MARTRFQRADQADSDCTPGSAGNKPLLSAQTGGDETVSASIVTQTMAANIFSFTTAAGDPGGENLPAGSLFRIQLDVTVAGGPLTYWALFLARTSSCGFLEDAQRMAESDFSGIGLKLATLTYDPAAAADRYQVRIQVAHGGMHGDPNETITIRTNNSNAFYEFPDAPGAIVTPSRPVVIRQAVHRAASY